MKQIPLTQGKFALVDDEDYDFLMQWKWYVSNYGYAVRSENFKKPSGEKTSRRIAMHRVILNAFKGQEVDHKDLDRLNNQKSNIRLCSSADNKRNRSIFKNNTTGFKGVYYHKTHKKYFASISIDCKLNHIGWFNTPDEASAAYQAVAKKEYGDFFRLD